MRVVAVLVVLVFALGSMALAQDAKPDARREQVRAAEADALEALRREVLATPVLADLTVGEFVSRAGAEKALEQALERAQQIGGTRWIDDRTCIIRFELEGSAVADALVRAAAKAPDKSPLPPDALTKRLEKWKTRTFSATGASTAAQYIMDIRPPADADPRWREIPEAQSREAVSAARSDAVRRVLEGLKSVELGEGKTVADALEVESVRQALQDWLVKRPVVGLEFGDDLDVKIKIAAPADEMWEVFRKALAAQNEVPAPVDEQGWQRLRNEMLGRAGAAVGRSFVPAAEQAAPRTPLPEQPPRWVFEPMDAAGSARGPAKSLKTRRSAEEDAHRRLREQIEALPLTPEMTVGEAAQADPYVREAISRSFLNARTYRARFGEDVVEVRVSFDPRDLWRQLEAGE